MGRGCASADLYALVLLSSHPPTPGSFSANLRIVSLAECKFVFTLFLTRHRMNTMSASSLNITPRDEQRDKRFIKIMRKSGAKINHRLVVFSLFEVNGYLFDFFFATTHGSIDLRYFDDV